jgi:seryl-tRNA synthetase
MLDSKLIRQDPEALRRALARRGYRFDVEKFLEIEGRRKALQLETEQLQNERNTKSKSIGKAKASGVDIAPLLAEVADLGDRLDRAKTAFERVQGEINELFLSIPNVPDDTVPDGSDDAANVELRRWREPGQFNFPPKDHVDLGVGGALDFEAASRISGARFVVMRGGLAKLQRALTQLMLDLHTIEHGYTEVYVPYLVNTDALVGTGQLPKFADDQFRVVGDDGLYLIPTAEVPVTNLFRDQIIEAERLPVRYVCHTPCFRSEAGSYGKDTRGIIRQHQFQKVELVKFTRPEESDAQHEQLTRDAEEILEALELPYRRVLLCTGDTGFSSAKTFDLEVWLPGQQLYREISSCSNFDAFQARRANIRYKPGGPKAKNEFVHTLNGSGLAVGRTWLAILENYQQADGSVLIPEALRPYMGTERITRQAG